MLINTISFRTIENTNFISSKNNNLIKRFRSFRGKSSSNEKEFFCIEGTHLLEELINAKITPEKVIATKEWLLINNSLIDGLNQELIFTVTKEVLRSCLTTKNPDGVAALVKLSSIKNFRICKEDNFILVLDRIQDPGNLGNLFRTALAAGINKVLLGGGANPLSQKVLRASCGSIFHLPFLRIEGDTEKVVSDLLINLEKISKNGFQVISTSSRKNSSINELKPYWQLDWSRPTALILGNEGGGVHPKIQEAFHETITIPHSELVESLNVACVAVPLLLERKRAALNSIGKFKK